MDWLDFITRPGLVFGLVAGVGVVVFALLARTISAAATNFDRMLDEGDDE